MFETKVVEKIQLHILCSVTSFFCAIHKMWANVVRASVIWLMCSACWINKAGDALSEYTILIAALRQPWLH